MIFRRTVGIVLRCTDYSETSKIVTIYTRDHGKVRALAKGAKRKKSDFLRILEPLSFLEIVYIQRKSGLHILKEACLIDSNLGLRQQLSKVARGLYFLSLVERTQPDEDPDRAVFELLSSSLSALRRLSFAENVPIVFQLRLLKHFGRLPSLTACGSCGSPWKGSATYDPQSGSFLCRACRKDGKRRLSRGTLQALRRLAEISLERCGRMRLSKEQRSQIAPVISAMLRTAVEADLPAESVVNSLLRGGETRCE